MSVTVHVDTSHFATLVGSDFNIIVSFDLLVAQECHLVHRPTTYRNIFGRTHSSGYNKNYSVQYVQNSGKNKPFID